MKVKEESTRAELQLKIKKTKTMTTELLQTMKMGKRQKILVILVQSSIQTETVAKKSRED